MFEFTQRDILLTLVRGTRGSEWSRSVNGWDRQSDAPVCTWDGIDCDESGKITMIDLTNQNLQGTIPYKLGKLTSLRILFLTGNRFSGTIPKSIARISEIRRFVLARNDLTGTVPQIKSSHLIQFNVSSNRLEGNLDELFNFVATESLMSVDVSHNNMEGTIPILPPYKHHHLDVLDLSFNHFTGTIPPRFADMNNLKYLFLNDNRLVGSIPPQIASNKMSLVQLFLQRNELSGTVPTGFEDVPDLEDLFLDDNKLTGKLPYSLCRKNLNSGYFYGPRNGPDRDGCNSVACPTGFYSNDGVYPCSRCDGESFTPYIGHRGQCFELNQRRILRQFYDHTNGPDWYGGKGWGVEGASLCGWEGIRCDSNGQVVNITLRNMGLRGTIPGDIGFLNRLRVLDLADNKLTGYLPGDLRLTSLEVLDVSGNLIKGAIPPLLCSRRDINRNGDNGFDGQNLCERVACPVGTYSPTGVATETTLCQPCRGGKYIGAKHCPLFGGASMVTGNLVKNHSAAAAANFFLGLFITALLVVGGLFGWKQYNRYTERIEYEGDAGPEATDDLFGPEAGCSYGEKNVSFYEDTEPRRFDIPPVIMGADHAAGGRSVMMSVAGGPDDYDDDNSEVEMIFEGIDGIPSRRNLRQDSTCTVDSDVAVR